MPVMVVIAAAAAAALFVWAVSRPLRLIISAEVEGIAVHLQVTVHYGRIRRRRDWTLPVLPPPKAHSTSPKPAFRLTPEIIDEAIWAYRLLNRITDRLWHRMRIVEFDVYAEIGLNDAAQTALWMGRATALLAWWIGLRIAPAAAVPPSWVVVPIWDRQIIAGKFTSIIQLLPSDIILAIVYGLMGQAKGGQHVYGHTVQQHSHA